MALFDFKNPYSQYAAYDMDPKELQRKSISQGLLGLSAGLLGSNRLGEGLSRGMLGFQQSQSQGLDDAMRQATFGFNLEETKRKRDEAAKKQKAIDDYILTQPAEQQPKLRAAAEAGALDNIIAESFKPAEAPKTREIRRGNQTVTQEWTPDKGWAEVASGPAFAPQQAPAPSEFDRLTAAAGLQPGSPEYQAAAQSKLGLGGGGAYEGTSMDAQNWNTILKGQTDTPEYAAAFNQLFEQPKMVQGEQGMKPIFMPKPANVKPPTGMVQPAGGGPVSLGQPTVGEVIPGTEPGLSPGQKTEYTKKKAQLDNLEVSLKQYEDTLSDLGPSLMGAVGFSTADNAKLKSSYTSLLIEMKNLFELGALSGPDYELMTSSVQDPNTLTGYRLGVEGLKPQLQLVRDKLAAARNIVESQYGQGGAGKVIRWKIVDGKLVQE